MIREMTGDLSDKEVRDQIASVGRWYHQIELRPGIVTPGINDSPVLLRNLRLPTDCSGMRVLDLGTRDGFFAFEVEKRGAAEVLAVDSIDANRTGFGVASRVLGSNVTYLHKNLYHLNEAEIGTFDIVLFLGLLYHLPDPIGGLRIARRLCRSRLYLETVIIDHELTLADGSRVAIEQLDPRLVDTPLMRFFPGDSFRGDPTNYWGPNVRCVRDMLAETEFSVVRVSASRDRAAFECVVASRPERAGHLDQATGLAPRG
ncbi:MAG: class I SAM-dependent methyltransferase [Vicinamibacterales bacterium]